MKTTPVIKTVMIEYEWRCESCKHRNKTFTDKSNYAVILTCAKCGFEYHAGQTVKELR